MLIDYKSLASQAEIWIVKKALKILSGSNEDCKIYLSFFTSKRGVVISDGLRNQYPEKMGIILEHQFNQLQVNECDFSVKLSFSGILQKITIPFFALEVFHDKIADFYLQFEGLSESDATHTSFEDGFDSKEKIISIDSFRKK